MHEAMMLRLLILVFLLSLPGAVEAQRLPGQESKTNALNNKRSLPDQNNPSVRKIFARIEEGFSAGSIGSIEDLIAPRLSLNIVGGERGTYSSSQALLILNRFFERHKPTAFVFSQVDEHGVTPYATGKLLFTNVGTRGATNVYVTLNKEPSGIWMLSGINIY